MQQEKYIFLNFILCVNYVYGTFKIPDLAFFSEISVVTQMIVKRQHG